LVNFIILFTLLLHAVEHNLNITGLTTNWRVH